MYSLWESAFLRRLTWPTTFGKCSISAAKVSWTKTSRERLVVTLQAGSGVFLRTYINSALQIWSDYQLGLAGGLFFLRWLREAPLVSASQVC